MRVYVCTIVVKRKCIDSLARLLNALKLENIGPLVFSTLLVHSNGNLRVNNVFDQLVC